MNWTAFYFPFFMRLTTWICLVAFIGLAVKRRDSKPLAAALVWLLGFEAIWDISREASGYHAAQHRIVMVILGLFTVAWFTRQGVRPSMPWIYLTAAIWIIWLGEGFHSNYHTFTGFDWTAEVLNVAAKTTLSVAYAVPLLKSSLELGASAPSWLSWPRLR